MCIAGLFTAEKENHIFRWYGTVITSLQSRFYMSLVLRTRLIQIRDCNSALDTSSIPPMHGGFLLISHKRLWHFLSCLMFRRFVPSFPIYRWIVLLTTINQKPCKMWYIYIHILIANYHSDTHAIFQVSGCLWRPVLCVINDVLPYYNSNGKNWTFSDILIHG